MPEKVFAYLETQEGREKFWAEKAPEHEGAIHFHFSNGHVYVGKIIHMEKDKEFHLDYFNSKVKFTLKATKDNGTDLTLVNEGIPDDEYLEVYAGWVSVLLTLKAAIDHDCDLRNHDRARTWNQKFVDN
ncbi:SRPBCC family protein [Flagellimonas meishanensis]|uniref:SRPBCC family protein n=1 Tax=Flagellimonas meishanensis TaxID=2873264 RepID=UPI001CA683AF|nr:SRPBCC domain-containing protein [[Muricauda] meishanensis]